MSAAGSTPPGLHLGKGEEVKQQTESNAALQARLESAENEMRRLGYGTEDIDVLLDDGTGFVSKRGDACWDTAPNRTRVRVRYHALTATLDKVRAAMNGWEPETGLSPTNRLLVIHAALSTAGAPDAGEPSTRHAVETAIDLTKDDKHSTWQELARKTKGARFEQRVANTAELTVSVMATSTTSESKGFSMEDSIDEYNATVPLIVTQPDPKGPELEQHTCERDQLAARVRELSEIRADLERANKSFGEGYTAALAEVETLRKGMTELAEQVCSLNELLQEERKASRELRGELLDALIKPLDSMHVARPLIQAALGLTDPAQRFIYNTPHYSLRVLHDAIISFKRRTKNHG
jgi:hypothetical protein